MAAPGQGRIERRLAAILGVGMTRQEFIAVLGGVAAAWPLAARAQKLVKVYRIAMVHPARPAAELTETSPFRPYWTFYQELRRLGYVEGQNLIVERYSGEGHVENYPAVARDVVGRKPDVILPIGSMVWHFKRATDTIPIVAMTGGDPTLTGLVPTLARPGGNITGVSIDVGFEIWGKRFELLREVVPRMRRVGVLTAFPAVGASAAIREAAERAGIVIVGPPLNSPIREPEYRRVFTAMSQESADAVIVADDAENDANRQLIVDLGENERLPTMYRSREFVEVGGLMAYAIDFNELFRLVASQIDQILKGTKPDEIPFYLPTKFDLVINLKTAKTLGIEMPPSLLARADEVIE